MSKAADALLRSAHCVQAADGEGKVSYASVARCLKSYLANESSTAARQRRICELARNQKFRAGDRINPDLSFEQARAALLRRDVVNVRSAVAGSHLTPKLKSIVFWSDQG